ncbi:unnamed protein product [Soboliphyme baturini]|uniref:C2H2-type domain-containing protein n=1 Tax=Soboliphyme baturini TaxID=241478 RepID=A0A183I9F1_9BILA|nr:unnamed protein product [Soboliphyme baturini]
MAEVVEVRTMQHTCVTCGVRFASQNLQRDHYKSEWHRYNVMRKAADLKSVSCIDFEEKLIAQLKVRTSEEGKPKSYFCSPCNKSFQSEETFDNHMKSKKHKVQQHRVESESSEEVKDDEPLPEGRTTHLLPDAESAPRGRV